MIVYYSEYSMFVVGDDVPKWLPKWASQLKTIMSDLRLRNGNSEGLRVGSVQVN